MCAQVACLCFGALPAQGGEVFSVVPHITVSEEFNDNIFLDSYNQKNDFITRITPGVALDYEAPFWHWRANADINYLYFARSTEGDQLYPAVTVSGNMRPINNFLYLDVYDSYTRVPLNTAYESMFVNQVNQNFLTVSPYLKFHPRQRLELTVGYTYKNTLYNQTDTVDWQEHDLSFRGAHEITPRSNYFVSLLYAYTTTSKNVNSDRVTPSVGIEYHYADGSHIYIEGGYNFIYTGESNFTSPYWNVGITYLFGPMVASLNGQVLYNTDPYRSITERRGITGGLKREFPRGAIGLTPYYYKTKDYATDSIIQTSYGLTLSGAYDFSDRLQGHLNVTGGKERGTTFINNSPSFVNEEGPPYHLVSVDCGLNYSLGHGFGLFFSYIHKSYLYESGNSSNVYNNRVTIGLSKNFSAGGADEQRR